MCSSFGKGPYGALCLSSRKDRPSTKQRLRKMSFSSSVLITETPQVPVMKLQPAGAATGAQDLTALGELQERRMKTAFVPSLLLTFSILLFDAGPRVFVKGLAFRIPCWKGILCAHRSLSSRTLLIVSSDLL